MMRFPVILAGILVLGLALAGIAGLIVAAVVLVVGYLISVRLNPRAAHRACGGVGRRGGWIYTWAHRRCQGCGGSGRVIRYGAARWGSQSVRLEAERQANAREQAKQAGAWR